MEHIISLDKQFQLIAMNGKTDERGGKLNGDCLVCVMEEHGVVRNDIVHERVQYSERIIFKHSMGKVMMFEVVVNIF